MVMKKGLHTFEGLVLIAFAICLPLWLIPTGVEMDSSAWLEPQVLPMVVAFGVFALGLSLLFQPQSASAEATNINWRFVMFFGYLLGAIWLLANLGFVYFSSAFVFGLMLIVGERRKLWLLGGTFVVPLVIWLLITQVLERHLM